MRVPECLEPFWHSNHATARMASHSGTQGNATVRSRIARAMHSAWHLTGRARTARALLPKPITIL
jgi:hypothetical protein